MKRRASILLLVLLYIFIIGGQGVRYAAAAAGDIEITKVAPTGTVRKGEIFELKLTLKNTSASPINTITVSIGSGSFHLFGGSGIYSNAGPLAPDGTLSDIVFRLTYDGGASGQVTVPITVEYNGGTKIYPENINVNIFEETSSPPPVYSPPVDTSKNAPVLTILTSSLPAAWAGSYFTLNLNIKNTGLYTAKNISITPELIEGGPFTIDSSSPVLRIDSINSDETKTASFRFMVSPYAEQKTHQIKFNFRYYNASGDFFGGAGDSSLSDTVYIRVMNMNTPPGLNIGGMEFIHPDNQPGDVIEAKLKIVNSGTMPAEDIKVTLAGLKDDGLTLYMDTNQKIIGEIPGAGEAVVSYILSPSSKMEAGNYGLTARIEYKDEIKKAYSSEYQFFVPVEHGAGSKSVPKIILSKYSCDPTIVKAGQNFDLNLTFQNTSRDKAVRNIKVFFSAPEGSSTTGTGGGSVFTPVNSSNTLFIDYIPPKGTYKKTLEFFTIPDASPKTYTLTANFEYEDKSATEYKSTEIIGIPVNQQIKIETSEIEFPPEAFVGQPNPITMNFYNTGKAPLSNMMVRVEGDCEIQNGKYFVGNFDIGASDYFEAMVIPRTPGTLKGSVIISYDEPSGEHVEVKKDFTMNVMEMPMPQMPPGGMPEGMDPNMQKKGGLLGSPLVWIGGAIVLVAGVFIAFRKIKKHREGMTLDE